MNWSQPSARARENVVIACVRCNQRKVGRTPVQASMRLRKEPAVPRTPPTGWRFTYGFKTGMPECWRAYLRDQVASVGYWHAELEHD